MQIDGFVAEIYRWGFQQILQKCVAMLNLMRKKQQQREKQQQKLSLSFSLWNTSTNEPGVNNCN